MKKQNLLKLAFIMMAMFVFTGAMAQNTGATQWDAESPVGDYVRSSPTTVLWNSPDDPTYTDKITVGATMPFWVWPSAVYNPDFDFNDVSTTDPYNDPADITLNVTSGFAWKMGPYDTDEAGTITAFGLLPAIGGFALNYVEIPFPAMGERLIQVIETPAAVSCPGDAVWFGVTVIDEPMVKMTDVGATEVGVPLVIAHGCEGTAAVAVAATAIGVTLDNADETAIGATDVSRYHINATYTVYNCDIDGGTGDVDWASRVVVAAPTIEQFGFDGLTAISEANPILAESTALFAGEDYIIEGTKATVYEYTLVGWNAGISRKSDYLAMAAGPYAYADYDEFSYYTRNSDGLAVLTNRIVVLPKPVTGPIYHIPNDFAF
jgi:hypothetical protein